MGFIGCKLSYPFHSSIHLSKLFPVLLQYRQVLRVGRGGEGREGTEKRGGRRGEKRVSGAGRRNKGMMREGKAGKVEISHTSSSQCAMCCCLEG